jgi:hypothetical protein
MPPKRRILVTFDGSTGPEGKIKRLAVSNLARSEFVLFLTLLTVQISIDEKATIAELANEVAGTIGQGQVMLEVGDGFELRNQE